MSVYAKNVVLLLHYSGQGAILNSGSRGIPNFIFYPLSDEIHVSVYTEFHGIAREANYGYPNDL